MFTGLVQAIGVVTKTEARRLTLEAPDAWPGDPFKEGESIAVDGCCLTLVGSGPDLAFDLSEETLSRTTLGSFTPGSKVNLERALRAGDRLGGHLVQGHVETTGTFICWRNDGIAEFRVNEQFASLLVDKGSVAIDGVSLTVVQPIKGTFTVALIPSTLQTTTLGDLNKGDMVNIEFDVLAKYALNRR